MAGEFEESALMVGQHYNSVFQQWLAAYGSHLEQVAQGKPPESEQISVERKDGSAGPNDIVSES